MLKTGIVLESTKESTSIMTCDCEFFNLKTKNNKALISDSIGGQDSVSAAMTIFKIDDAVCP